MIQFEDTLKGGYRFVIKSNSGAPLLKSVLFSDKTQLKSTVNAICYNSKDNTKIERKTNMDGKFLFHLKSKNGSLLGESGLYTSEAGMENGINNLKNSLDHLTKIPEI